MKKSSSSISFAFFPQIPAVASCALAIFGILFCLSPGWLLSDDASARLVIARQLWRLGTVFLPSGTLRPERFLETSEGLTTYFGIGQTLLFIPFDMLGVFFAKLVSAPSATPSALKGHLETLPLTLFYLPLMGLFWWHSIFRWLYSNGQPKAQSLLIATTVFLTSLSLPYAAQSLQEESVIGGLVLHFMTEIHLGMKNHRPAHFLKSGALLGLTLLFRTNAIFALTIALAIGIDEGRTALTHWRRSVWYFFLGSLTPLLALLYFNAWRFGNPFLLGHMLHYVTLISSGIIPWREVNPKIATALVFGLGKGFFTLSPLLLVSFGIFAIPALFRRFTLTLPFGILVLSALFHSRLNGFSCGGIAWGPRFQVHLIGLFALPVAAIWRWVPKKLLLSLVAFGLIIQTAAVLAPDSLEYKQEMVRYGDYVEALIASPTDGQLPMRLRNIFNWIVGIPLSGESLTSPVISQYRTYYLPNIWPFQISRLWPGSKSLFLLIWFSVFATSLVLLCRGLQQSEGQNQSPPPELTRWKLRKLPILLDT